MVQPGEPWPYAARGTAYYPTSYNKCGNEVDPVEAAGAVEAAAAGESEEGRTIGCSMAI
jgi:hypothetical protein